MKRLNSLGVSPHIDTKVIRKQMEDVKKYKKTIQGTSGRHQDVTGLYYRAQLKKAMIGDMRR